MLQKIKTKKFWISFVGIVIMLLQLFGVKVDAPYVNEVANSICAVLILIGLLDPGKSEVSPEGANDNTTDGDTDSFDKTKEESFSSVEHSDGQIIS